MPPDPTDKVVAAIFASAMIRKMDAPRAEDFLDQYDTCLQAMETRQSALDHAAEREKEAAWSKFGR